MTTTTATKRRRAQGGKANAKRMTAGDGMTYLDFDSLCDRASQTIEGTCKDLIRDRHGLSKRWLWNSQGQPDDRRRAFLIGRGWSATNERRMRIKRAGIPVMAINDYPESPAFKPDFWCTGDPPHYFPERIWTDIEVMKFTPLGSHELRRRAGADAYDPDFKLTPGDAPNVHFFHTTNNEMEMESWLHLPWIPWGTTLWGENVPRQLYNKGAARSSMLIGLRLLWHLGFREVYLLGCDCGPGAIASPGLVHDNPAVEYWNVIFHLLEQVKPTFDRFCYRVINCNPASHLRTFEFTKFDDIVP